VYVTIDAITDNPATAPSDAVVKISNSIMQFYIF